MTASVVEVVVEGPAVVVAGACVRSGPFCRASQATGAERGGSAGRGVGLGVLEWASRWLPKWPRST